MYCGMYYTELLLCNRRDLVIQHCPQKKKNQMKDRWDYFLPLHPSHPVSPDEKAHAVLVLGAKGTVLFPSTDNLIPLTSTANLNQEHRKGTRIIGSQAELVGFL